MPPTQCPECGRFLENAFIVTSGDTGLSCPRCGGLLTASMSGDEVARVSVRPPDLQPEAVRDHTFDVLAGWDVGVGQAEIAAWRQDRRPFPTDTVAVAGAAVAGLLIGLLLTPHHRARDACAGAVTGALGVAVVRRVWTLRA